MKIDYIPHCDDESCGLGTLEYQCPHCLKDVVDLENWFVARSAYWDDNAVIIICPECKQEIEVDRDGKIVELTASASRDELRAMTNAEFVDYLKHLLDGGRSQSASVAVIDYIDHLHTRGCFEQSNSLLKMLNLSAMPSHLRRAFLMITRPAKDKLPARESVYQQAVRLLARERGGEAAARRLLKSLA